MKLVVDVNLPPRWVEFLATRGIEAVHWSQVGDLRATDALESGAIVTIDEIAAATLPAPIGCGHTRPAFAASPSTAPCRSNGEQSDWPS